MRARVLVCVDMCMAAGRRVPVYRQVYRHAHVDMCVKMRMAVQVEECLCIGICIDVCIDIHVDV